MATLALSLLARKFLTLKVSGGKVQFGLRQNFHFLRSGGTPLTEVSTTPKPRWLAVNDKPSLHAACFSPCSGSWRAEWDDHDDLLPRILTCLENPKLKTPQINRAFFLRTGLDSARVATVDDWTKTKRIGTTTFCGGPPVEATWLLPHETAIAQVVGRPVALALGGEHALAFIYTDLILPTVVEAFRSREVSVEDITVHGFFAHPGQPDYFHRLTRSCKGLNIPTVYVERRLPAEGKFGYHGNPNQSNANLTALTALPH